MLLVEVQRHIKVRRRVAEYITRTNSHDYFLQLASNLLKLEDEDDQAGLDQLWEAYGYRDCMRALIYVNDHADNLPEPTVTNIHGEGFRVPMQVVPFSELRPITELVDKLPRGYDGLRLNDSGGHC